MPASADPRPPPSGSPPPINAATDAQTRARIDAEDRPKVGPAAWNAGIAEVEQQRQEAWLARVGAARPPDVVVRLPVVELTSQARFGLFAECPCGYGGVEAGLTFRFSPNFGIDLPVGVLHGVKDSSRSWTMLSARPAFVVSGMSKGGVYYARIGPDLLVPVDTNLPLPSLMLGGFLGVGGTLFLASLGDGGYIGLGVDAALPIRGGVGSGASALDPVRVGMDLAAGLRVAF